MLCFWSFSLALPSPKSAEGTAFGTHTTVNKPKTSHGSIGSHGFKGFGGGHATRKREASPEPLPSSEGNNFGTHILNVSVLLLWHRDPAKLCRVNYAAQILYKLRRGLSNAVSYTESHCQ